jgi:2-oxo-4-hydroxy-4-carboxy--5-ureidoimidazoline (OHCU) decarboxylase
VRGILTNAMLTGTVHYNRRKMKLDRQTGRRVARFKPQSEHKHYVDASLAIIGQDDFDRVQAKLSQSGGSNHGKRATKSTRALTGLVYCGECGSVCYTRKSKNRKGEYHYLACGHRQRFGLDSCENAKSVREDLIVSDAMRVLASIFDDTDAIVREAAAEARRIMGTKRSDAARLRQDIADIDRQTAQLVHLLTDPDIDALAKKSISRQLGTAEAHREQLQAAMDQTRDDNTADRLVTIIQGVLADAKETFQTATPAQINQLLEQFMGPVILRPDGKLIQKCQLDPPPEKTTTPAGAGVVTSNIVCAQLL